MTLDIAKFIANSIRMQAKVHHLDVATKTTSTDDIPESVKSLITKQYGNKYLDDADYVAFFWGGLGKEEVNKLFNVVDKALGKSANKLTDTDFKKIDMGNDANAEDQLEDNAQQIEDAVSDEDLEDNNGSSDEDADTDIDVDIDIDDEPDDEPDDEDNEDDEDSDQLDEDDEMDVSMQVETPKPTTYFFLKITVK